MNKIEQVARAINAVQVFTRFNDWSSDRVDGLTVEVCRHGGDGEDDVVVIERFPRDVPEYDALFEVVSRLRARAAIEAMRVPTEGMVEAGHDSVGPFCDHNPSAAWQSMIDAALEGK